MKIKYPQKIYTIDKNFFKLVHCIFLVGIAFRELLDSYFFKSRSRCAVSFLNEFRCHGLIKLYFFRFGVNFLNINFVYNKIYLFPTPKLLVEIIYLFNVTWHSFVILRVLGVLWNFIEWFLVLIKVAIIDKLFSNYKKVSEFWYFGFRQNSTEDICKGLLWL